MTAGGRLSAALAATNAGYRIERELGVPSVSADT